MTNSHGGFVQVRGARVHNLRNIDVRMPRDALVVFTGVSGSGKSSLALGTLYAEAQRRYLESVSPYARRLFHQLAVPEVEAIEGLPPAVALQQQRGGTTTRSSVGSVTTLSNLLRMLYSRAGTYPPGQPILHAESFSPNTPEGACPASHGLGQVHDVSERAMVPDDSLTIREGAIASWPPAWQGQNQRDIVTTLGIDVDVPWRKLPKKERDWLLYTEEQPRVPVYAGYTPPEVRRALKRKEEPSYMGTFAGARAYVLRTFATTESDLMKRRVQRFMESRTCPTCGGKRLRPEALRVRFAGRDIAEMSRLPLAELAATCRPFASGTAKGWKKLEREHPERAVATQRIAEDMLGRLTVLVELGLGYLSPERSTPTLSPGELQRLRLGTQVHSSLFGVVYVLDEPSAGLHPADTEALLSVLARLKASGNSLFVVEHEVDVICEADWIVDIGPAAGEHGGQVLYSGPPAGLATVEASQTRRYLSGARTGALRIPRRPTKWLRLAGVTRNNLRNLSVDFPLGVLTTVTGVSGSGKSSLVSQALVELVSGALGHDDEEGAKRANSADDGGEEGPMGLDPAGAQPTTGMIRDGLEGVRRLIRVDQRPIGRTPRSNLATYTGLFDQVRALFAATPTARARRYKAGRFSFNVSQGRCAECQGEGFVMIELLFLPSVYAPCPVCRGTRYNDETLEVRYRGRNIAEVLGMTVDDAWIFFEGVDGVRRSLEVLRNVGAGYLRLGQPATELSGGEAQRIKLATELQRGTTGNALYVLDEPTTGLHPADVELLMAQLQELVERGNTVVVVEHDLHVMAESDWILDVGPGAGSEGGTVVAAAPPSSLRNVRKSRTAPYLDRYLNGAS
jgi:excinuclease ABC subunit A